MRVFLAVPAGERLAAAVTLGLDGWGDCLPLRWTRPETWHLTLQFLGDWPENRVHDLIRALEAVRSEEAFVLQPGKLEAFPSLRSPRVLFLQMQGDGRPAALAASVRRIVTETWSAGPQDDKPFRGHVTLARVRGKLPRESINLLKDIRLGTLPEVSVEEVQLLRSDLSPRGIRHTVLARFGLRKKGE